VLPSAPMAIPRKTLPSARAKRAGLLKRTSALGYAIVHLQKSETELDTTVILSSR
jgi:hypothetical protein